eukprot:245177-Karenia_brevis.AAC.1
MVAYEILVIIFWPVRTKGSYPRIYEAFWNGDYCRMRSNVLNPNSYDVYIQQIDAYASNHDRNTAVQNMLGDHGQNTVVQNTMGNMNVDVIYVYYE